jgi:hypothetical protein
VQTPWERFYGVQPDISHLRIFGSMAYPRIPDRYRASKVDPVAWKGFMVGYESKAYRIYLPAVTRVIVSKDVAFIEQTGRKRARDPADEGTDSNFEGEEAVQPADQPRQLVVSEQPAEDEVPASPASSSGSSDSDAGGDTGESSSDAGNPSPDSSPPDSPAPDQPAGPRRSARLATQTAKPQPYWMGSASASSATVSISTPVTLSEALSGPQAEEWRQAVNEELASLHANGTWELMPLPSGRKAIPCKWVFKLKMDSAGNVDRFKARLVAKGFAQREGIDYNEVFAPVSKYATLRALLALIAINNMEVKQADVKTAFLYGYLDEEIYMEQPPGFREGDAKIVCKLKRSLYGLKQAPRAWYTRMSGELVKQGFSASDADTALLIRDINGIYVYLLGLRRLPAGST